MTKNKAGKWILSHFAYNIQLSHGKIEQHPKSSHSNICTKGTIQYYTSSFVYLYVLFQINRTT